MPSYTSCKTIACVAWGMTFSSCHLAKISHDTSVLEIKFVNIVSVKSFGAQRGWRPPNNKRFECLLERDPCVFTLLTIYIAWCGPGSKADGQFPS